MSVRKLSFYITDAQVTIKCDHLPLRKFLQKQTLNAKVNNWAVELEQFNLHIEWIQGTKNTLADSLSRLLDVDPSAKIQPENEGCEFGNYCFEQLEETGEIPPILSTPVKEQVEHLEVTVNEDTMRSIKLPLTDKQMKELQKRDEEARSLVRRLDYDKMMEKLFIIDDGKRNIQMHFCTKSIKRTIASVSTQQRRTQRWSKNIHGPKEDVLLAWYEEGYLQTLHCAECVLQNQGNSAAEFGHFSTPDMPMELICMDLVGPISPVTSHGNKFILTCIDMLTGFTMAIPIRDKMADTICDAYRSHIYCTFGGSSRILTDNGTEFKNDQFTELCKQLDIKRVYSPVYTPEANGRLEAWHRFFKACVAKHIQGSAAEWDEVVPLAVAAYNFFPCQSSAESPFVLMFGRDPVTPFAKLLEPTPRYWGDKGGHLKIDLLKKLYLVTAENIKRAKDQQDPARKEEKKDFKVNDQVLVRDVTSGAFAPRYSPHYRVIAVHGPNRIVVRDKKGNESVKRASHLKHCNPKTKFSSMIPDNKEYEEFGRSTKLLLHSKDVPELQFPVEPIMMEEKSTAKTFTANCVIESIADNTNRSGEISEISPDLGDDSNDNSNNNGEQRLKGVEEMSGEILLVKLREQP